SMQATGLSRLFAEGRAPLRVGNRHPVTVPVDTFQAKDGVFAMVVPSDAHFGRRCTLIGRPGLATDARFKDNPARARHEQVLKDEIESWSRELSLEECVAACAQAEIPAGPVWDLQQAARSEHASSRGLLSRVPHPAFGTLELASQPARFSSGPQAAPAREPLLGEHTREVLRERLGLSDAEIEGL